MHSWVDSYQLTAPPTRDGTRDGPAVNRDIDDRDSRLGPSSRRRHDVCPYSDRTPPDCSSNQHSSDSGTMPVGIPGSPPAVDPAEIDAHRQHSVTFQAHGILSSQTCQDRRKSDNNRQTNGASDTDGTGERPRKRSFACGSLASTLVRDVPNDEFAVSGIDRRRNSNGWVTIVAEDYWEIASGTSQVE